jgi:hypothetical protein
MTGSSLNWTTMVMVLDRNRLFHIPSIISDVCIGKKCMRCLSRSWLTGPCSRAHVQPFLNPGECKWAKCWASPESHRRKYLDDASHRRGLFYSLLDSRSLDSHRDPSRGECIQHSNKRQIYLGGDSLASILLVWWEDWAHLENHI